MYKSNMFYRKYSFILRMLVGGGAGLFSSHDVDGGEAVGAVVGAVILR